MSARESMVRGVGLLTLRETRRRLRSPGGWPLAAGLAGVYALVSMLIGQMLVLEPIGGDHFAMILWSGNGTHPWDYPGLLVVASWGILSLPLFPTIAMAIVAVGVGIGGAAGILLILPALRRIAGGHRRAASMGAAAGVGPALTGLATLGACCCTTCAGAAGISVVAATSGASLNQLLLDDWYIGVFQIAVVAVSLLAQERAFRWTGPDCPVPPPMDRRFAAGAGLRLALLIAGVTWSLAMFVEWGAGPAVLGSGAVVYHDIFEHQALALLAVGAALFPREVARAFFPVARTLGGRAARAALGASAVTWAVGVPPFLVAVGLGGFVNEALGYLGVGPAGGGIPPDSPWGLALAFHWVAQHLLLGAFALAVAIAPARALVPLLWSTPGGRAAIAGALPAPARRVDGSPAAAAAVSTTPAMEQGGS